MRGAVHLPFAPLLSASRCTGVSELAELLRQHHLYASCDVANLRRSLSRWQAEGVTISSADHLAIALGLNPASIWGPQWDLNDPTPAENAAQRRVMLQRLASRAPKRLADRPEDVLLIDRVVARHERRLRRFVAGYLRELEVA